MIIEGDIGPWGPLVEIGVRSSVGSRRGMAILDSGARLSVVDVGMAQAVGASVVRSQQAKGVCGVCLMQVYRLDIDVGGLRFPGVEMLGKPDLLTPEPLQGPSAPGFVALLGQDFLQLGVLHCDGPKRRFRFETE